MIKITDEEIMGTLRAVVRERPDFVYEPPPGASDTCVYVADGAPSCLVAHVLHRHGASLEGLARVDKAAWVSPVGSIRDVAEVSGLDISDRAGEALGSAQIAQDTGHLWSEALSRAEEVFNG